MSERALPGDVHPQSLLLPWFLSGTLAESERKEVAAHLVACERCSAELATLTRDRRLLRETLAEAPTITRDLRPEVLRGIEARRSSPGARAAREARPGWWRVALVPRLAAAVAVCLILTQSVVILRLASIPAPAPQVTTRGLAAPTSRLRLVPAAAAPTSQIDELLRRLNARIVDGPAADGALVVEVTTTDRERLAEKLALARADPRLILDAQLLPR